MIVFFTKSQLALFQQPVHVEAHVRKDGAYVPEHTRMQHVAHHPPTQPRAAAAPRIVAQKRSKLDAFIAKHGGPKELGNVLANMTASQQQRLFAEMGKLDGSPPEAVAQRFGDLAAAPDEAHNADLFAAKPAVKRESKFKPDDLVEFDEKGKKQPVTARVKRTDPTDGTVDVVIVDRAFRSKFKAGQSLRRFEEDLRAHVPGAKPAATPAPTPEPVAAAGPAKKRVRDPEGNHTLVTHEDGGTNRIIRLNSVESMGVPGWHDMDVDEYSFLADTEDEAVKVLAAKRKPVAPPPPVAEPHNPLAPFGVSAGISKAARRELNDQVIGRLEQGGPYTDEDKAMLRQYSGNGGCGDSLNEYYTDADVTRAMWTVVRSLGFASGTALEPSSGTGVFLHTAPEGFRCTAVELDPVSANVAHALHGDRHEVVTASLERFATSDDRQFDVVIGNPPYGPRGFLVKDDKKFISTAENYFVDTSLDKCKPGGVVALVVPTGILDSKSGRAFREHLARKGQFLGALRMPNTAFEHSHTEVTTDVIFMRKRPDDVAGALMTVDHPELQRLGVWDEEFIGGGYFTGRGASNILGTMGPGWRAQAGMGDDITVSGSMAGVPEAIAEFTPDAEARDALSLSVADILSELPEELRDRAIAGAQRPRPYANTAKVGDTKTVDGVTYILQGEPPRWHRIDEFVQAPAIADAAPIAAEIDRLFTGQAVDRPALETAIKAYVEKYGVPADNPDLMIAAMADKTLYRLVGAVNRKGELSDAVSGRAPRKMEGTFDATAQALSLDSDSGHFTAAKLAEMLGKDLEDVTDQLAADPRYAYEGDGVWSSMDVYVTGELWPKLDAARAMLLTEAAAAFKDKLTDQVAKLEKLIEPKLLDDVDFQLNSAFLPLHVIEAHLDWKNKEGPGANEWTKKLEPVKIMFADGVYTIAGGSVWGDVKLLDKYLNRTGVKKDELDSVDRMNDAFKTWLCASEYRDAVEELYNRKFRGFVPRSYSNAPIDVPGLATDRDVRDWRWSGLRRNLADGKGIIADDVGLGKTLGGLLLARMAKIRGTANKPIIVVPKSVLANWYAETQLWFPGSRVLSIGANFAHDSNGELVGRDDDATERKRKYHDLTQNDYDFIIISEPAFEEIDLDPMTKEEYYSQDFWVQRGEALGNAGDKRRKAIKERYEQHLAQREFADRTDAIWFNELGVDLLIDDELHHQKNLYAARARFGDTPKFLGGQGLSNRALDFNLKARWVREHNGGKGVFGMTATPTKNSPLEIYSMLSHIAPEAFEKIGIRNSEEFLDRFCEFTNDKVLSTQGAIEDALVVSGFKNMNELREIMYRYIDRRTADDVGLKLPERQQKMHLVDMTQAQKDVYDELRALAEESSGKKDATGDSHIFSIMDKMNKAALDLSLLGGKHVGAASPKFAALAEQIVEGVKDGGQLVFCEAIDTHDKIKRALVDAGLKATDIGIINAQVAGSAVKRQNIADALNKGKLKVVIGNCVMAEGLNMQKTTSDIHELDIPWEPASVQQRLGRGIRQGNLREAVRTHSYLSKGSFDGYRYQAVHAKRDWMDLLWNGGDRVENLARESVPSLDDMRIMLAADPDEARKKFDEDKTAAMKRFEAGARSEAQSQFVRFAELSRSYAGLKNKATASGTRLRDRIESAKTALFNNKYWPAKGALDNAADTLVHPETGTVLGAGQGLDFGAEGKMVVTGVNMRGGTVTMRHWGNTAGSKNVTVPMVELADAQPFKHDEKAEAAHVTAKFEEDAAANLNSLTKWDDIKALPTSVIDANKDLIQAQVKQGQKDYTFTMPYGDIPMIHKETGKLETVASYHARGQHATHDYLLPTSDAIARAQDAWIEARRGARIGSESHHSSGRRKTKSYKTAAREYENTPYDARHRNPMRSVLAQFGGDTGYGVTPRLVKEAQARLETEQLDRIKRAPTIKDAVEAVMPLAKVEGRNEDYGDSGHTAKYPKKALTMLWARARYLDALHTPMSQARDPRHSSYAVARHEDKSVHNALVGMARASGHHDLAEAMVRSDQADKNSSNIPDETVRVLAHGFARDHSHRSLTQLLRAAEQSGMADKTVSQLREHRLSGHFSAPSGYSANSYGYDRSGETLREKITELLGSAKDD